jgi:hypothetical protein
MPKRRDGQATLALIARLRSLPDGSDPRPTLAEFDTVLVD